MKCPKQMSNDELFFESIRLLRDGHKDLKDASRILRPYSVAFGSMEARISFNYQSILARYNSETQKLLQ